MYTMSTREMKQLSGQHAHVHIDSPVPPPGLTVVERQLWEQIKYLRRHPNSVPGKHFVNGGFQVIDGMIRYF